MNVRFFLAFSFAWWACSATSPILAQPLPVFSEKVLSRLSLLDVARAGSRIVAVGARGYIIYSDDSGKSWRQARTPTQAMLTATYFINDVKGWAVGHDSSIWTTDDGGLNWRQQYVDSKSGAPLLDVWFKNAHFGVAVGAYGAYFETRDGGTSWQSRKIIEDDKHINAIAAQGERIYLAGEGGLLYVSDDSGGAWRVAISPYSGSFFGLLALPDNVALAFGLRGNIVRSLDGGLTWRAAQSPTRASLMGGEISRNGDIFLSGLAGTLLFSPDQGLNFTSLPVVSGKGWAALLAVDLDQLVLVGEAGIKSVSLRRPPRYQLTP